MALVEQFHNVCTFDKTNFIDFSETWQAKIILYFCKFWLQKIFHSLRGAKVLENLVATIKFNMINMFPTQIFTNVIKCSYTNIKEVLICVTNLVMKDADWNY